MKKLTLWSLVPATFVGRGAARSGYNRHRPAKIPRVVMKISKVEAGGMKTTMYSIDQNAPGMPSGVTTLQGSAVKITISGLEGTYEGKLSSDANSMAGTWSQGPGTLPLNLTRATSAIPEPPGQPMFHREKKELSVYAIVVGKNGSKLTKSEGDPNGLPSLFFRGLGVLPAQNATLADFAGVMQSAVLDRPVVDQTGLSGRFDFTLTWTPDEFQFAGLGARIPPPTDNATAPPDLFTAMQEQLGLKLEATTAPAEVLVIDSVAKPSEN